MSDNQREAMFNGWKNNKKVIYPFIEKTPYYCLIQAKYGDGIIEEKVFQSDMFGDSNTYHIAFNRVLSQLKKIDEKYEMEYDIKIENSFTFVSPYENYIDYVVPETAEKVIVSEVSMTNTKYFQDWLCENGKKVVDDTKQTLVINLFGAPGSGKSTLASYIFAELKMMDFDVELVSEYAKELVWEERSETMKDEIYIFAKQNHRFFRLKDKVKVIVTDRPLALSKFYNKKYGKKSTAFDTLVDESISEYDNFNVFLKRGDITYNTDGRNQTEEESKEFENEMYRMYFDVISTFEESSNKEVVLGKVIERIKKQDWYK